MTDQYAVVGNPVAHSKSPLIHAEFARQTGQDMAYDRLLAPLDGFAETAEAFRQSGGKGLNVTVPFKEQAFRYANRKTARAEAAGAVNTLMFDAQGIVGDNTDGAGLVRDLTVNLRQGLMEKRILLMGAGGAARGVIGPLLAEQPAKLVLANRTVQKAQQLAEMFGGKFDTVPYEALAGLRFDVVINATAASLKGELPPLPDDLFNPGALAYDMMYGTETPFMAWARRHGATKISDGLGMLVEQAAESFYLWRGVRPDTAPVIQMLRAA
jgi:shikimate dehydrogenase